jgi:hypothetical protein
MTLSKNCVPKGKQLPFMKTDILPSREWKIRIERASHVPLTLGGKAKFMIANVLAATLASYGDLKPKILAYRYKLSFQVQHKLWTYEYI